MRTRTLTVNIDSDLDLALQTLRRHFHDKWREDFTEDDALLWLLELGRDTMAKAHGIGPAVGLPVTVNMEGQ